MIQKIYYLCPINIYHGGYVNPIWEIQGFTIFNYLTRNDTGKFLYKRKKVALYNFFKFNSYGDRKNLVSKNAKIATAQFSTESY